MQCQPFFLYSWRKSLAHIETCTLAKTLRLTPAPWKPLQTLRKLKLKISRTLWTCACAFSPGLLALMLDYTPSVPPLPPLKYGSDGRKGQQPVWGGSSGGGGWEVRGGGSHSELCLTFTGPKTGGKQRERERVMGGLSAVNGVFHKAVALSLAADHAWHIIWGSGLSRGLGRFRFMCWQRLGLITNLNFEVLCLATFSNHIFF